MISAQGRATWHPGHPLLHDAKAPDRHLLQSSSATLVCGALAEQMTVMLQAGEEDQEEVQFEPMLVFGAGKEAAFAAEAKALRRSLHKVRAPPLPSACDLQYHPGTLAGLHALGLVHAGGYFLAWTSW